MSVFPIVKRELAVIANRAGARWVRTALIAIAILFCLQQFALGAGTLSKSAGYAAFHVLSTVTFLLAFGAAFLTADCVSSERREGTLGLLFLTDLKGHDVVLGKLAATGLNALYAIIGFAPVLMLPLLVGGVTGGEVARTSLALLNSLIIALTAGMVVTVRARTRARAMRDTCLLILSLFALPYLPLLFYHPMPRFPLHWLSPMYALICSQESVILTAGKGFWISLALVQLEAWALLGLASFLLLRGWRDSFEVHRAKSGHELRRARRATTAIPVVPRYAFRAFAPVAYAMLRLRGQRALAWAAAWVSCLASLVSSAGIVRLGVPTVFVGVSAVLYFGASAIFAWVAGRFLLEARRSGELELLLPTPVGAMGIVRDQWFALLRLLRGPLILVVAGQIPAAARRIVVGQGMELLGLLSAVASMANAVLGVLAVSWMAMWLGSRVKRPVALIGWTVGVVELGAVILSYLVVFLLLGVISPTANRRGNLVLVGLWSVALPFLLVGKNLFFILWAHDRLRREFRTVGVFNVGQRLKRAWQEVPEHNAPETTSEPG